MFESILVGTDGSDVAGAAVSRAVAMAATLGARLQIVSAYEPVPERRLRIERPQFLAVVGAIGVQVSGGVALDDDVGTNQAGQGEHREVLEVVGPGFRRGLRLIAEGLTRRRTSGRQLLMRPLS